MRYGTSFKDMFVHKAHPFFSFFSWHYYCQCLFSDYDNDSLYILERLARLTYILSIMKSSMLATSEQFKYGGYGTIYHLYIL